MRHPAFQAGDGPRPRQGALARMVILSEDTAAALDRIAAIAEDVYGRPLDRSTLLGLIVRAHDGRTRRPGTEGGAK